MNSLHLPGLKHKKERPLRSIINGWIGICSCYSYNQLSFVALLKNSKLGVPKFSSEPRFEPRTVRTEPWFRFSSVQFHLLGRQFWFWFSALGYVPNLVNATAPNFNYIFTVQITRQLSWSHITQNFMHAQCTYEVNKLKWSIAKCFPIKDTRINYLKR